jgi:hypothetical protein
MRGRKLGIAVLAAALVAVSSVTSSTADSRPTVVCATLDGLQRHYRVAPRWCILDGTHGRAVRFRDLHWKWRSRRAFGLGSTNAEGGERRVRVKLSRPIERCGGRRFTHVRLILPNPPRYDFHFGLRTCVHLHRGG